MAGPHFRVKLDRTRTRRLLTALVSINLGLCASTILFMLLWARLPDLSPRLQGVTRHVLVQGHLATENVVAAWYSSMLLLTVAVAAIVAWRIDRARGESRLHTGWLGVAVIFLTLSLDEIGSLHERIGMVRRFDGRALGWVYVLAVPIAAVAALMTAFAWLHLRRIRATAHFMIAGLVLFLLDPLFENVEMALVHGATFEPGSWQRMVHDVLLVVEEGALELFGILCFLAAVAIYVMARSGRTVEWTVTRKVRWLAAAIAVLLAAGAFVATPLVSLLPEGDTGIAANWFPAAAWLLVALAAITQTSTPRSAAFGLAALALSASAISGAGLYGYAGWVASRAAWVAPVCSTVLAGLSLEAVLSSYLFRRSPMSSIASPTLRRPRPNPS
jgi:hypothetical protein